VAIPNKLIISEDKVHGSELQPILDKYALFHSLFWFNNEQTCCEFDGFRYPELFDEEKCGDADFNILALYLMFEKLKGDKSFWHPYFELN